MIQETSKNVCLWEKSTVPGYPDILPLHIAHLQLQCKKLPAGGDATLPRLLGSRSALTTGKASGFLAAISLAALGVGRQRGPSAHGLVSAFETVSPALTG